MPVSTGNTAWAALLAAYMRSEDPAWQETITRAVLANSWFTEEYVRMAADNIATALLDPGKLDAWVNQYPRTRDIHTVGIVMAGNIPLVGFHDFLCGLVSGHRLVLKLSSKDNILLPHLAEKMVAWDPSLDGRVVFADMLKGCDAYIATGSNNSARYFEQYFGRFPHIIRRNRTSVAVLTGTETPDELRALAQDIFAYFGLGCRNVTQVCVPAGYDFTPLLEVLRAYDTLMLHHKYKNNYDYHLAIYLLNRVPYLTNDSVLLVENELPFSPVSVLHYRYYQDRDTLLQSLSAGTDIQCIVGAGQLPFGQTQQPGLTDYADGVDTMQFLTGL